MSARVVSRPQGDPRPLVSYTSADCNKKNFGSQNSSLGGRVKSRSKAEERRLGPNGLSSRSTFFDSNDFSRSVQRSSNFLNFYDREPTVIIKRRNQYNPFGPPGSDPHSNSDPNCARTTSSSHSSSCSSSGPHSSSRDRTKEELNPLVYALGIAILITSIGFSLPARQARNWFKGWVPVDILLSLVIICQGIFVELRR